jgi:hypothetical protein
VREEREGHGKKDIPHVKEKEERIIAMSAGTNH